MNQTGLTAVKGSCQGDVKKVAAGFFWTAGIIGFFVLQAILWTVAITLTYRDPSHAVLEGYDQRALHWDEYQEQLRESKDLNWSCELETNASSERVGHQKMTLRIKDRDHQPVTGAVVMVKVFHRARAGEQQLLAFSEVVPGEYCAEATVQASNGWQFEINAVQGERRFMKTLRQDLTVAQSR
jgi:nitrogen fixation protein FixH